MSELFMKEEKVLTFKDIEGVPAEIKSIDNPELLPFCLKNGCTIDSIKKWLKNRYIPKNREGLDEVRELFGERWLDNKNYASLSDHYWIKMRNENWKRINFFTNKYSSDIGDIFFSPWDFTKKKIDSFSPDLTTNGVLKKRWLQDNSTKLSRLVKAGSVKTKQEPLNEVLVSVLVEKLGCIKSAGYDFHIEGTTMCSICDNFITTDTELVPAHYIYFLKEKSDSDSVYSHILKMCELYDIPDAEEYLNWVVFIDNITGNEDRNLNNIAFLLDVNTRKFLGPAPLYDCGNAYWNTKNVNDAVKSKLFGDMENNIFSIMKKKCDLSKLDINDDVKKIITTYPCITDVKKDNLIKAMENRNKNLLRKNENLISTR